MVVESPAASGATLWCRVQLSSLCWRFRPAIWFSCLQILIQRLVGLFGHRSGRNPCSIRRAGSGDTCGCRPLLGGTAMAFPRAPLRASGETLGPVHRIRRRRRYDVVPFLKASSWLLATCLVLSLEMLDAVFGLGCFSRQGIRGAMYDIVGASSMASSFGLTESCNPLADSSRRLWWGVR